MIDAHLRQLFPRHLPTVHHQAIETGGVGLGVPDLNGCIDGVEFWIELKRANHWRINLSPPQIAWSERRIRAGGRVFIAARRQLQRIDELYLFHAGMGRRLLTERLDAVPALGMWSGGPKRWDWVEILAILTGPFPAVELTTPQLEKAV